MPRIIVFALAAFLVASQSGKSAPLLTISIDAPVQSDSPVHITGFRHDERDLWFALSNSSEKTVTSVILGNISWAPLGCAIEDTDTRSIDHARFLVRMGPRGNGIALSKYVHFPKILVYSARDLKTAYLLTQIVVDAVYFEDGTTWPADLPSRQGSVLGPFDPKRFEAEKCSDVAAVVNGLGPIQEVAFVRDSHTTSTDDRESVLPHLRFSCSLEGSKAVCRMPLETDHAPAQPQPLAAEQR